jgi:hypothetical protein
MQLSSAEPIQEVLKAAFDTSLPVKGGWGYTQEEATVLQDNPQNMPLSQLEHMLASMRTYLEMNMTQTEANRYGSINLNEISRQTFTLDQRSYHQVTYTITAMKESLYTTFIEEYKEKYGKEGFDMDAHFQRRKEATLIRHESYWFDITAVI